VIVSEATVFNMWNKPPYLLRYGRFLMLMLTLMRDKDSAMQDILNETSVMHIILREGVCLKEVE
jgi:hypothetical protein